MKGKVKSIAIFLVLIMVFNIFAPTMKVFAEGTPYPAKVSLGTGTVDGSNVIYDVDGTNVVLILATGITVDMENAKQITVTVNGETGEIQGITAGPSFNDATMKITLSTSGGNTTLIVDNAKLKLESGASIPSSGEVATLMVQKKAPTPPPGEDNPNPPQPGNTERTINVSSTGIIPRVTILDRKSENPDDEWFADVMTEEGQGSATFRRDADKYYIRVEPDFITRGRIKSIKINGDPKTIQRPTGMNFYEVSPANTYNIEVVGEEEEHYNIMWANDGADVTGDYDSDDVKLKNGSAKVVKVYDNETNMNEITEEIDRSDEGCLSPQGEGYVSLAPGNVVIFEFEPQYGYQLTSVKANGFKLDPQEDTNQYKYVMPDINVHFQAEFSKTEDIVKAESEKIASGTIELGSKLDGGTVQLKVADTELSSDKITGFEKAAGDYTISNYLDIDLYNVFYKGKSDSDDVWSNKISELDKEATITLKLAEGVNVDDIVIVHNIHDGDEFEIIEIESYDAETNTITFKTKSFSNYAIATKTTSTTEETTSDNTQTTDTSSNPTTGDNIITITTIFAIALFGAFTTIKLNKNRRVRKH